MTETTVETETPPSKGSGLLLGWLAAFGVLFIWSGWVVVSRFGVLNTLTVYDIAVLRFLVAFLAVSPFVVKYWPRRLAFWKILVLGGSVGVPFLLLALFGMRFAPASHAGILLNGTLPIFAAAILWLWVGQRPVRMEAVGIGVILAGCILTGWDRGSDGLLPQAWIGQLLFVAAALVLAVYMCATRLWGVRPIEAMVVIPTVNIALFGPVYLALLPKNLDRAPWSEILLQGLYQGLGPSILGVICFTQAVRSLGSTRTAAMMAGVPGLAALMAIPVLGEWPSLVAWGGLAVTTAGILLMVPERK
ncbi:MAG: DMT family transporter [Pseudomonadota bacterium]